MTSAGIEPGARAGAPSLTRVRHGAVCLAGLAAACQLVACHHGLRPREPQPVEPGAIIEARSDAGETLKFRIDSAMADPGDRDGDVWLYGVSVQRAGSSAWSPYCLPDADGRSAAIPVQGSWSNRNGDPLASSRAITLACTSGAIGKCIRFGYKPWATRDGISLRAHHAACVRMVRADYCGDGRPHTVDGTEIDIWDGLGIQVRTPEDSHPEVFEAAWSPAGAAYLNVPRWSDDVADVIADCPAHLAGRTSRDQRLTPSQIQERFPESLIFNARFVLSPDRQRAAGDRDAASASEAARAGR